MQHASGMPGADGALVVAADGALAVAADGSVATRLATLYQRAPLRGLRPREPDGGSLTVYVTNTGGGLVGGDTVTVAATATDVARLRLAAQAAEKVYRSTGPDCQVSVALTARDSAWLEWTPQETIVFDRARLRRATTVDVADQAHVLAGEILVFGRTAHGERTCTGTLHEAWTVIRNGHPVWRDALHLDGDVAGRLDAPAGFGGAVAAATVVLAGPGADQILLEGLRALLPAPGATVRAGATLVRGVLLTRILAHNTADLRRVFAAAWSHIRHAVAGLPPAMPVLWHI